MTTVGNIKKSLIMLKNLILEINEAVSKRTEFFENHSDTWKISDTGQKYYNKTGQLKEISSNLNNEMQSLKTFAL